MMKAYNSQKLIISAMAIPFSFYFISRTAKDPFLHVKNEHFNIYVPARAELGVEEMTIVAKFLFIYPPLRGN